MENLDEYKLATPPVNETEENHFGYCNLCGEEVLIYNLENFENKKSCNECIKMDNEYKSLEMKKNKREIEETLIHHGLDGVTDFINEKSKEQLINTIKIIAVVALIIVGILFFNKYL